MTGAAAVERIFVVMMENRSFDHLLGHLALEGRDVDGLRADPTWLDRVASRYAGRGYPPYPLDDPYDAIEADPPHGRSAIGTQLGTLSNGRYAMDGFVESYSHAKGASPIGAQSKPPVMGWFSGAHAPVTDFLARSFAVCDHWHAALPAGTQPNRLMAMSGTTRIDENRVPLPSQDLVYDWLTHRGVRWRVYHAGIPFFAMMPQWIGPVLEERNFRPFDRFFDDVQNEPPDEFPEVVFLEPIYSDAPHVGPSSDDHAPAGIRGGQEFLLEVYRALSRSPDVWRGSVLVLTYDEHGGFFDHVSPPAVVTAPPPDAFFATSFVSLGVRVPAIVVSPLVAPGSVAHQVFDHTSILKLIGEVHGGGEGYSAEVDARPVASVSVVLTGADPARPAPVAPSISEYLARAPAHGGRTPGTAPQTEIEVGFQDALDRMRSHPARSQEQFQDLVASFPPASGATR